jgi:hypothetical protein
MKLASKFIAALAVVASSSSFAADITEVVDLAVTPITDFSTIADFAVLGADGSMAVITQSGIESNALILQDTPNVAVINQSAEAASAVIIQTGGEGNVAAIIQN